MSKISTIVLTLKNRPKYIPMIIWGKIVSTGIFNKLPDSFFLCLSYFIAFGRVLNLKCPKTFNEKLQWLKINDRKDIYCRMVDKAYAKDYVKEVLGAEYLIQTFGVWDCFDDVDFDKLPDAFVLKTTGGGGGNDVYICRDKSKIDKHKLAMKYNKCLNRNNYYWGREWPYKNNCNRIIAEQLLQTKDNSEIKDYKFFCFSGSVRYIKVDFNRFVEHRANYYTPEWDLCNWGETVCPPDFNHKEEPPYRLQDMINIAEKLSNNIPFLRVDLYNVAGHIFFGELTFYPNSGFGSFTNSETDIMLGDLLLLPTL